MYCWWDIIEKQRYDFNFIAFKFYGVPLLALVY